MDALTARERLLAAAEEAFLRDGYGRANLSEIAKAAGISKKTIYKLVASKADLFAAVVSNAIDLAHVAVSLEEASDGDVAGPLRAFLTPYARLSLSVRGAQADRLVTAEAQQFPELAKAYGDSIEKAATQPLIRWLARQAASGAIAIASADRAARMLVAMVITDPMKMLILGQRSDFDDVEIVRFVDEAVTIFLSGTLTR